MTELTVGIRDFKANLSAYLKKLEKGQTIAITSHGKVVGRVVPPVADDDVTARMKALVDAGVILWNGEKLKPVKPVKLTRSDVLASDIIIAMRNESLY
jgi:prevent-host-death family protein